MEHSQSVVMFGKSVYDLAVLENELLRLPYANTDVHFAVKCLRQNINELTRIAPVLSELISDEPNIFVDGIIHITEGLWVLRVRT